MADLDDKALDALLEKHETCTDSDVIQELVGALREARAERDAAIAGWNAFGAKIAAVRALCSDETKMCSECDEYSGAVSMSDVIRALDGDGAAPPGAQVKPDGE